MLNPDFQQYYSTSDASSLLARPGVLAVIAFEPKCEKPTCPGVIPIGLSSLCQIGKEVIQVGNAIAKRGEENDCHWSSIGDVMCASVWISKADCVDIASSTCSAYLKLYGVLRARGFSNVFRLWNFIPRINSGQGDCEEYKKFCVGRQKAFSELNVDKHQYPAASALGHHSDGAVIYALASRSVAGVHHENNRQQSAYHYPRQYGPVSPSFSRATSVKMAQFQQIFISGTASILGHATQASLDLDEQLRITVENIAHLISAISDQARAYSAIRVYLRHARDYECARHYLKDVYPEEATNFLLADICRANLLVEIEAASCFVDEPLAIRA